MAGWLLDTNVVSEFVRPSPDPNVVVWVRQMEPSTLFLSALTIGEATRGARRMADGRRRQAIERWIRNDLIGLFADRILEFDTDIAVLWGGMIAESERRGRPCGTIDAQIAATAAHHRLTLVTRNMRDFEGLLSDIVNPWSV